MPDKTATPNPLAAPQIAAADLSGQRSPAALGDVASRQRYYVVALGCALAAIGYVMRVSFAWVGPALQQDLGLDKQQFGQLMSVFALAYGAFEIPAGYSGDRFGARLTLLVVILGFSGMTAVTAAARSFVGLLAARFAFGSFQAGIFPNIARMFAAWMPVTQRGTAQGWIWMCTRIGGAISPVLVVGLLTLVGDWRATLLVLALPGVIWAIVFYWWYRDHPIQSTRVNAAEVELIRLGREPHAGTHANVPWAKLLSSGNLWALCLAYGFGGFGSFFNISLLPTYLESDLHVDREAASWIGATAYSVGAVACFSSGWWSDRIVRRLGARKWGRRLFGAAGFGVGGLLWLIVAARFGMRDWTEPATMVDIVILGALVCSLALFYDLTMPVSWAATADIGERYAGTVSGMMNTLGNLGAASGAWVAGGLMQDRHTGLMFTLFALAYFAAGLCWLRIDSTQPVVGGEVQVTT
ncbi:MAG: MFS transporter [Pirellulales bacterium]|nr:MFS transporter [Pirellulales bacterium]